MKTSLASATGVSPWVSTSTWSDRFCKTSVIPTVSPAKNSLAYCHINDFQRASRLARPFQGGEKMTAVWASHHEELCSAGVVAPHVHTHMVAPHRWGVLDGGNPLGSAVDASRRPSMGRPLPHYLMRNALLDLTTILPATAYHRRSYAERYSRYKAPFVKSREREGSSLRGVERG